MQMRTGQMRTGLIAVLMLALCGADPAASQSAPVPVKVAVYVAPPLVMQPADGYTGFSWEIWQQAAGDLKLTYAVQTVASISQLLQLLRDKQIDIAVADLSITGERFRTMDFTEPYIDAGLRIMIDENRRTGMGTLIIELRQGGHLRIYGWIGVIIVLGTIVLTLIDRRYHPEFPARWTDGLAEAFYHVMSVATSGSASHRNLLGAIGRILGAIWLACGVAVVAYVTSSITSVMTVSKMTYQINDFSDLRGKHVGVLEATVAEAFCCEAMLDVQSFATMDEAVDALQKREISAIVDDAPQLEWYDKAHPDLPITVVGPVFKTKNYGFALPLNSPLTRPISEAILHLQDTGALDALRTRYFGTTR
jgi:polar amino acid transport system substrate-binding protein